MTRAASDAWADPGTSRLAAPAGAAVATAWANTAPEAGYNAGTPPAPMGSSLRLGRFAGIDVFVHWTFALLIAYVVGIVLAADRPLADAVGVVLLVLATFACVVFHEYGHALTARRFGVPTKDITLYPIGGVARLQRIPEAPPQELAVAIAGPLVNVAIAAVIAVVLVASGVGIGPPQSLLDPDAAFWSNILWINVILVVFNLIPAFPMDGGRVLRALLATRLPYVRATKIAAGVGQAMAIGFAIWGVMGGGILLLVIAFFVFIGAQQEAAATTMRTAIRGIPVSQAMLTQFTTLGPGSTLREAVEHLMAGSEQEFAVLGVDGRVMGVLTRKNLAAALAQAGPDARVVEVMSPACPAADANEMLASVLERMQTDDCALLPVERNGRLVGVLSMENVTELLMLSEAMQKRTGRRAVTEVLSPRDPAGPGGTRGPLAPEAG
jgi:Zn-dependent protease